MESLYLLIPLSILLVFAILVLFAWSLGAGQFDDLERQGLAVLEAEEVAQGDPADGAQKTADSSAVALTTHSPLAPPDPISRSGNA